MFLMRIGITSSGSSFTQSARGFANVTKFTPAANAAVKQREKLGVQPAPLERPRPAAPREGAGSLVQGFGGGSSRAGRQGGYGRGPNSRQAQPRSSDKNNKDLVKETTLSESATIYTKIITVGRVSRMTGQGRKQQFRALVVLGNGNGAAGFGVGKGLNPKSALASAIREGEKDLVFIDRTPWGSLYHDVQGKCNTTKVVIKAIEADRWYQSASLLMRSIFECAGISNYSCFVVGRKNPFTVVNAAFDALGRHQTPKEMAFRRGRQLLDKANPEYFTKESVH